MIINKEKIMQDNAVNKFTNKQLDTLRKIGHGILVTCDANLNPRGSMVEPSFFSENEIDIPVVQLNKSFKNIKENKNIFLHFIKENKKDYGWSTQYKISAVAKVVYKGELFDKVKHFEETERLSGDMKVHAVIRAMITNIEEVVG